jgi:hypothetical protein
LGKKVPVNSAKRGEQVKGSFATDLGNFFLDGHLSECGERQGEEKADASVENDEGIAEGADDLFGRPGIPGL